MMNDFYLRAYLAGHSGQTMPRLVRRLIAGTELHRAWLLGAMGFFEQGGIRYGPANPYSVAADTPERT
ncbi:MULTISPECIES: hypothetical protein [Roseobacteraceae]|uniref:Uncharacterized protein n=1 Tax=Pseudosulfitobacter pseudonitzschiae TaxID=1402135 RepID=A0A221K8E5_9RHOB|nr:MULTISPECIES: hypothetical protein [Roseobacteraceae]ASM75140.1 hypothetical protein SULPSESMR1_04419 [Pseudosulfitobacter pseudonitzschiae]